MDVKPGWKSSEFWITVFTTGGALIGSYSGMIPQPWGTIAAAVCTFGYTIARAYTKSSSPVVTNSAITNSPIVVENK